MFTRRRQAASFPKSDRMKMKQLLLLALAALACSARLSIAETEEFNFEALENSLRFEQQQEFNPDALLRHARKLHPGIETNLQTLQLMAGQTAYPFVSIAGLSGLRVLDANRAFRVSLLRCWNSINISSFEYVPFLGCLTNQLSQSDFIGEFSATARLPFRHMKNAVIAIQQLPTDSLFHWLLAPETATNSIVVQALVLDRLISARKQILPKQVESLHTKLEAFKGESGVPLAVYLLHVEADALRFVPGFESILRDGSIDITLKQMLIKKYAKALDGRLNIDQMNISGREKERLKNWLTKYAK